jgi:hypothetical protein
MDLLQVKGPMHEIPDRLRALDDQLVILNEN